MRPHRRRWRASLLAVAVLASVCGADAGGDGTATPRSSPPALVAIGAGLLGPSGLAASVVAEGLTDVAALAIDGEGSLWAATAAFADDGGDGVWLVAAAGSAPQRVIDDVHTPLGLLWIGDTLYVSSHERVDAYTGFDGKRRFTETHVVVVLPDGVGEVNGMALGPDGRIALGVSAPCDVRTPSLPESAAVLTFAPDGSDLRVEASGIRAPVGLTYLPGTDDLFVTMNQRDDLGEATPGDWLALVEAGQDWGFPDCYGQDDDTCEATPTPVAELDPHAAVSGVAIVTGQLGASLGTAAVVAQWATGTVQAVPLTATDDGWSGRAQVLVSGLEHPVPVLATAAGVLVGDWGTGTVYLITTSP